MVDRVHRDTSNLGPLAQPPALAGLSDGEQLVLGVADFPDGRETASVDQPHLRRAEPEGHILAFLRDYLSAGPGGAGELATPSNFQFHIVHVGAQRDFAERDRISGAGIRTWT